MDEATKAHHHMDITVTVTHNGGMVSEQTVTFDQDVGDPFTVEFGKEDFERDFVDFLKEYFIKGFLVKYIRPALKDNSPLTARQNIRKMTDDE